jgi:hypothetical protein
MANLLGQNIGTNYKGILNLNTLNGNLSGTLQAVTDGDGNASPLTLSTGEVGISRTIALSAGSSNVRLINETYTINNSGAQTGTATGIFLNATETALNGMTHNLMDLQVGGVSRFEVGRILDVAFNFNDSSDRFSLFTISRVGSPTTPALFFGTGSGPTGTQGRIAANGDNLALGTVTSNIFTERLIITTSNLIALGGTTNAFPALKRNAAGIDFVNAADTGFAPITAGDDSKFRGLFRFQDTSGNSRGLVYPDGYLTSGSHFFWNGTIGVGVLGVNISAILQLDSTTRGFLPPRQTTTQKNAISSPATGLVVYDTTLNKLAVYTGSAWETVTSI